MDFKVLSQHTHPNLISANTPAIPKVAVRVKSPYNLAQFKK